MRTCVVLPQRQVVAPGDGEVGERLLEEFDEVVLEGQTVLLAEVESR